MCPSDEPHDADPAAGLQAQHPPIGPVARDALLRAIARRLGGDVLQGHGIAVPPEPRIGAGLNLLSASIPAEGLPDGASAAVEAIAAGQGDAPITWVGDDEQVAIVSAAHATDWLIEAARLARGLDDLAALCTEGRSDVALLQLARLLTLD